MSNIIDVFRDQQNKAKNIQYKLLKFIEQGENAGVKIDIAFKNKLKQSIRGDQKLQIALIGGFSEGKTSIAAAWLGRHEKEMKISHQESSNAITVYEAGDDITLIDTPGLFGYKEKYNPDIEDQEKYKDITRKFVSEAHIVIYVMNSTNPIKESHSHELKWLLRDLNLLSRTIFVLSRFDEVSDVSDEEDYQSTLQIKKDNIKNRLKDIINLNEEEAKSLSLVAVSANPYDAGLEYWLSNSSKYEQLSHIHVLMNETTKKITGAGGLEQIALATSKSIIQDILIREIPEAIKNDEILSTEISKLEKTDLRANRDISDVQKKADRSRLLLKEFVINHFTNLIIQLKGTSIETISKFFEREIGDGGIILDNKIQMVFSKYLDSVTSELVRIQTSLNSDINEFDSHMIAIGKEGVNWIAKSKIINSSSVLAARDLLWSSFKFKPWGAIKFANGLNGALGALSIAFDAWQVWKDIDRKKQFENGKNELVKDLESQRRELIKKLDSPDFYTTFFPGFKELKQEIENLNAELERIKAQKLFFTSWRNEAEIIDAEFQVINID